MSLLTKVSSGPEPPPRVDALTPAQGELLLRLARSSVDRDMADRWNPVVGSFDRALDGFLRAGLLRPASLAAKIDATQRVADLKPLLAERSLKVSGKKAELIERLLAAMGEAGAERRLAPGVRMYAPTPTGEETIARILAAKEAARQAMEVEAGAVLRRGDAVAAGARVARYEAKQVFARGMGITWSEGMPDTYVERAARLLEFAYDDLPLPPATRREIGVQLALGELLGEGVATTGKRLLALTGSSFACEPLARFLREEPCGGYAASMHPDEPRHLAELYAHTMLFTMLLGVLARVVALLSAVPPASLDQLRKAAQAMVPRLRAVNFRPAPTRAALALAPPG